MKTNSNRGSAKLPQNPQKKQPRTRASGGSKPINPDRAAAGDGLVSALRAAMGEELLWGVRAAAQAAAMPLPAYILEAAEVYSDHDQSRRKAFPDGSGLTLSLTISRDLHARLVEAGRLQGIGVDVLAGRALSGAVAVVGPQPGGGGNAGKAKARNNPGTPAATVPQPGAGTVADSSLRALEVPINTAIGLVSFLGGGWAAARENERDPICAASLGGCGLGEFADMIGKDLLRSWTKAHDAVLASVGESAACDKLRVHLQEAAAFTHAGCRALANEQALAGSTEFQRMNAAYCALAERMTRFLAVFHDEVPVFPYQPKLTLVDGKAGSSRKDSRSAGQCASTGRRSTT